MTLGREGDVTCVTLDWPENRNALDPDRIAQLTDAISAGAAEARVLVLTGNGAFCAGADLRVVADRTRLSEEAHRRSISGGAHALVRAVVDTSIPVLAAVDGPAIGLGFDLALACDCRLVGPEGWFVQGWGRVGLIPGAGGELLVRLRNPSVLWRLLEQQRIDAAEAERWGLGEAVRDGTAREAALRRADVLSELPSEVLEAYVAMSRSILRRELPEHLRQCGELQSRLLAQRALADRATRVLDS